MARSNPVIFVPGITASYLTDEYALPPEAIWTVLTKDYLRSALHPDDRRYEAVEPARVVAGQVYEICYRELIEELRYNLRETEDEAVPVFPFAYDWRQPLAHSEARLSDFIAEVIERTLLIRHYDADAGWKADPRVNLVGHSMGGLIIAGCLQKLGAKARVGKVATLASPFDGSFEAVIKVTTGTANLGTAAPSSREREAARLTPALYHLMPGKIGGLRLPESLADSTLFDIDVWQPSIVDTIREYIRLRGLRPDNLDAQARGALADMLDEARRHRQRLYRLDLARNGLEAKDWLCVAGVDAVTRVELEVDLVRGKPEFAFDSADRRNNWADGDVARQWETGDGTVPLHGAVPKFLAPENVVCVTPDDYGYWELGDIGMARVAGFHGMLPAMDMVHRLIVRHFTGRADSRGNTWGVPLPGIAKAAWKPPLALELKDRRAK